MLFALLTLNIAFNVKQWTRNQIFHYDVCGYHNYLPAVFIYHDLFHFRYFNTIDSVYHPAGVKRYALYSINETGRVCNQYPIGVALFQAPAFLIAHFYCSNQHAYAADGYSSPYQLATFFSTWFFVIMGLLLLRKFLQAYFNDTIILITLLILSAGTNLYVYSVQEPGLSHPYMFFIYAAVLYLTQQWYLHATWQKSALLGLCIGLCAVTRPVDALIFVVPILWTNDILSTWKLKGTYWLNHTFKILIALLVGLIIIMLQFIYWKLVSGHWIHYSYSSSDYFSFNHPQILNGLFSYRKGWFLYSPILIIGFIGAVMIFKKSPTHFYILPFWAFFIPMFYIVFSWHMWTYGWSFSCRALLETIPLLALPMAVFLKKISRFKMSLLLPIGLLIVILLVLSVFQTWQYTQGILSGDAINKKYYWTIFARTTVNRTQLDSIIHEQRLIDQREGNGL